MASSRASAAAKPAASPPAPAGADRDAARPSAAKIAAERNIDLNGVAGSGKRGQVLKGDVLGALAPARRCPSPPPRRSRRPSRRARPFPTTRRAKNACA